MSDLAPAGFPSPPGQASTGISGEINPVTGRLKLQRSPSSPARLSSPVKASTPASTSSYLRSVSTLAGAGSNTGKPLVANRPATGHRPTPLTPPSSPPFTKLRQPFCHANDPLSAPNLHGYPPHRRHAPPADDVKNAIPISSSPPVVFNLPTSNVSIGLTSLRHHPSHRWLGEEDDSTGEEEGPASFGFNSEEEKEEGCGRFDQRGRRPISRSPSNGPNSFDRTVDFKSGEFAYFIYLFNPTSKK